MSDMMSKKEYDEACRIGELTSAKNLVKDDFLLVVERIITKARIFPDYPIETLKLEAFDWFKL